MPKSPQDKKKKNYNNGGGQTRYKAARWEQNGKMVDAPKSRKNPPRLGWN